MNIITEATAIEGVPIKEVMIDAICGAACNTKVLEWAMGQSLARSIGREWNRAMLGMLELDALFAVYGRVKRK